MSTNTQGVEASPSVPPQPPKEREVAEQQTPQPFSLDVRGSTTWVVSSALSYIPLPALAPADKPSEQITTDAPKPSEQEVTNTYVRLDQPGTEIPPAPLLQQPTGTQTAYEFYPDDWTGDVEKITTQVSVSQFQ